MGEKELSMVRAEYDEMKKADELNALERDELKDDLSKALSASKELEIEVGEVSRHRDELSRSKTQHLQVVEELEYELKQTKSLYDDESKGALLLGEELKESGSMRDSLEDELRVVGESHR